MQQVASQESFWESVIHSLKLWNHKIQRPQIEFSLHPEI